MVGFNLKTITSLCGSMLLSQFTVAASGRVVVLPIFISHLSSRFAAAILPSFPEASVPVRPDDTVVQPCAIDETHCIFCACSCVVFYEAESTGSLLDLIQTNDDALHVSTFRKQLVYLFLGGVEGQIPNIQSVTLLQQLLLFISVSLKMLVSILTNIDVRIAGQRV